MRQLQKDTKWKQKKTNEKPKEEQRILWCEYKFKFDYFELAFEWNCAANRTIYLKFIHFTGILIFFSSRNRTILDT